VLLRGSDGKLRGCYPGSGCIGPLRLLREGPIDYNRQMMGGRSRRPVVHGVPVIPVAVEGVLIHPDTPHRVPDQFVNFSQKQRGYLRPSDISYGSQDSRRRSNTATGHQGVVEGSPTSATTSDQGQVPGTERQ
jgi:hypothetical protein